MGEALDWEMLEEELDAERDQRDDQGLQADEEEHEPAPVRRPRVTAWTFPPLSAEDKAEIERKRKLPQKPPADARRGPGKTEPKAKTNVSLSTRLADYPGETFRISGGQLYCGGCRQIIANVKGTIDRHKETRKHEKNVAKFKAKQADDGEIKVELGQYFAAHPDEAGGGIDEDEGLYRFRAVQTFMMSGTPLMRADFFRPLLQRAGYQLTGSGNLGTYVPRIQERETTESRGEVKGQQMGVSLDGTTRLGEAINLTGRWVDADFNIVQRLLGFVTTRLHVDSRMLSRVVVQVLAREMGIKEEDVVNFSRDSAAVNGASIGNLTTTPYDCAEDTMCICHTVCHVGAHFILPTLAQFMAPWLLLVGGRNPHRGAQAAWKRLVAPQVVPGFSNVRWHCKAEIQYVIAENGMVKVEELLKMCFDNGWGDSTYVDLCTIVQTKQFELRVDLAAMLDTRVVARTTYALEGDRLELLLTYRRIETLRALGRSIAAEEDGVLPNVDHVIRSSVKLLGGARITTVRKLVNGHGVLVGRVTAGPTQVASTLYPGQQRDAYTISYPGGVQETLEVELIRNHIIVTGHPQRQRVCNGLSHGFDYLENRITGNCQANYSLVHMYEVCRLAQAWDPQYALVHVNAAFIDALAHIKPIAKKIDLQKLKQELPTYRAAAAGAAFDDDDVAAYSKAVLKWWADNHKKIPEWSKAARIIFAISPNSASCERVFSLLENMFGDAQNAALSDYISTALKLRYNGRRVG